MIAKKLNTGNCYYYSIHSPRNMNFRLDIYYPSWLTLYYIHHREVITSNNFKVLSLVINPYYDSKET